MTAAARAPLSAPPAESSQPGATAAVGRAGARPSGPAGPRPGTAGPSAPSGTRGPRRRLPERARLLVAAFAQLFLEVECGRRAAGQLAALMHPRAWAQLAPVWVRASPQGQVVRVRGMPVGAGRYEATVVVRRGERFGALAVTIAPASHRPGWVVTAAARPEDGPLPEPLWVLPQAEPDAFDLVAVDACAAPACTGAKR